MDVFDLLNSIKNEFETELKKAYTTQNKNDNTIENFSKSMLQVFLENKELVKILFTTNNGLYFFNDILEIAYSKCKIKWEEDIPNINEEDMEYAAIFIFNGALGIINFWVKNDFHKDINEIAKMIETLSYFGTKKYIYKK